jgi:SAM-dependent methyltransferase
MGVTLLESLRYGWQILHGSRVAGERQIAEERRRDIYPYLDEHHVLKILDLGNGSLRPQYTILAAGGHTVFGIDFINRSSRNLFGLACQVARVTYQWKLGLSIRFNPNRLVCGDVSCLPFPSGTFDLVTSVAAFEHFLDVSQVLKEVYRILRPGGMLYARIHLFTCLSGGHNVGVAQVPLVRLPRGIEAWDHLRKRQLRLDVPLNEWRKAQYLAEFQKHFEIVRHYCAMREGEHLLTPQIESELSNYSRDELTCGAYVIVARKPP